MADQDTRARDDAGSSDAPSETPATTDGADTGTAADTTESSGSAADPGSSAKAEPSEKSGSSDKAGSSEKSGSSAAADGGSDEGRSPARRSENHAKPQAPTDTDREAQEANRRSFLGGDRSDGDAPTGERRRSAVDVGELVWKIANVLATVIRVVTLVFAVVLVAHIALVVVGVNPANGVASFLRGFADTVVLGFSDLFLPADPTIALVVNYGVAAVFWVVVGGFVSAGIRFLAARIS